MSPLPLISFHYSSAQPEDEDSSDVSTLRGGHGVMPNEAPRRRYSSSPDLTETLLSAHSDAHALPAVIGLDRVSATSSWFCFDAISGPSLVDI